MICKVIPDATQTSPTKVLRAYMEIANWAGLNENPGRPTLQSEPAQFSIWAGPLCDLGRLTFSFRPAQFNTYKEEL